MIVLVVEGSALSVFFVFEGVVPHTLTAANKAVSQAALRGRSGAKGFQTTAATASRAIVLWS